MEKNKRPTSSNTNAKKNVGETAKKMLEANDNAEKFRYATLESLRWL